MQCTILMLVMSEPQYDNVIRIWQFERIDNETGVPRWLVGASSPKLLGCIGERYV